MKRYIPNLLTCCGLLTGCVAIVQISRGNLGWIPALVWIAAFFDFVDGFIARWLGVSSPMGKELDSLSDMVSFGLVPGYLVFALLGDMGGAGWIPYGGFIITLASALRLAKYNIDERQSDQFIGLPTPANAIFFSGLMWLPASVTDYLNVPILLGLTVVFSYLLNAELPLVALKFKSYNWKDNISRYLIIISAVVLLIIFNLRAISAIVVVYLFISILFPTKSRINQ